MEEDSGTVYSGLAMDHARNPRNMGILPVFDGQASVAGSCGDSMDMWLRIEDRRIVEARFTTDGCGSSRACGSMATELATGRHLAAAMLLRPQDVLQAFDGFPDESAHCAELAIEALQGACQDYFRSLPMGLVPRKILVISGKGGVGKSTVAVHLARRLARGGAPVGLLDADIHGPSVAPLLGIGKIELERSGDRLKAHSHQGLRVMSMGLLVSDPDNALALRGPRKTVLVRQFLREVDWGELEALVVDTPPGTGDELMTVVKSAGPLEGAVVVSTPSPVARAGARRSVAFCREMDVPVLGILENMSGSVCPHCGELSGAKDGDLGGDAARFAEELGVPFLGRLPLDGEGGNSEAFRGALDAAFAKLAEPRRGG